MSAPCRIGPVVAVTGTSLMVGCGGNYAGSCGSYGGSYGSYGSYGTCWVPVIDAAGIYEGSLTSGSVSQAQPVVTIVAESGDGRMSGGDDTYYRLNIATVGSDLSGTFTAYSQSGSLPSGTPSISGSISGVLTPSDLKATLTSPGSSQQSLALTVDNIYKSGSSLTTLAGSWTSTSKGLTLMATIQPDGSFMALDSNNCTYTGSFSIIDPNFNAYAESHVRTCGTVNVTFTGLAAFFPGTGSGVTGTPTQITVLTDNAAGEYLVASLQ